MSFEKFTDKARKVLVLAQDEARALHQPYVGTEHILLGLIKEKDGLAAQALDRLNVKYDDVVSNIRQVVAIDEAADVSRPPVVHPAHETRAGELAARGDADGPELHLHRAPAARHRPRRGGHGAQRAGPPRRQGRRHPRRAQRPRRPKPGLRRPQRVRAGRAAVRQHAQGVRHRPHAEGARRQARPGHRPRGRDRARHAGPQAAARRTTRCSSASPAWARPPSAEGLAQLIVANQVPDILRGKQPDHARRVGPGRRQRSTAASSRSA